MKLSLIIPCYNEKDNILKFYETAEEVFKNEKFDLEYVFVNDGSNDGTFDVLKELYEEKNSNFCIVSFSRNFGKEAAIYAGLSKATGDYITIIDADLQQRPEVVLEMVEILNKDEKIDCVAAFQDRRKESGLLVWFKNKFYKIINKMTGLPFVNGASDFRTFRRPVLEAILSMCENDRFSKGIFSWVGFETKYIPYEVMKRESGSSKWSFFKLLKYAITGIMSFTTSPLNISFLLSFLSILGSSIYYVIAIILALCGKGWSTFGLLFSTMFFVGGMIMLCIAILGLYLSKIYLQAKNRPIYIAKNILTKEKEKK